MTAMLSATGLAVRRGGRVVLEDVDLHVDGGELVCLVGPNGAGKSTLLAALAGDLDPTAGQVHLLGDDIAGLSPSERARRRAVLLQSPVLGQGFRVREVVAMGREPWPPDLAADSEALAAAAAEADIEHLLDRRVGRLSGGEAARVALARVLAQRAPVMLWDEPVAALDLGHQVGVLDVARHACRAGAAVVVVLHDLSLAAAVADRIVVLREGRVVAHGAPADVVTEALLGAVYGGAVTVMTHPTTGRPVVAPTPATAR